MSITWAAFDIAPLHRPRMEQATNEDIIKLRMSKVSSQVSDLALS